MLVASSASAGPRVRKPSDPKKIGAVARVAYGRELRPTRLSVGRRTEPLTDEEQAAADIQKLLRTSVLRRGVTGLYVADARTGDPLFSVNGEDPLNPASNVKMISTATSLELLGSTFRYPTRVLGPTPVNGVVTGDVYLLGSYDPTLAFGDFDDLAGTLAARGITQIQGNLISGADPTRDGLYRASIPIEIAAGDPGAAATVTLPPNFDLVEIKTTATTARRTRRSRLSYKLEQSTTATGQPRITLTIGGTIGIGRKVTYPLPSSKARTAIAAYALIAALRSHSIAFSGEWKTLELGDYVGDSIAHGNLPVELGRHESASIAEIVRRINKWSINWLADRLVVTGAALTRRAPPSMQLAIDAMYAWLDRHPHLSRNHIVLDTGSGLSYNTEISPRQLVSVVRSAAGFTADRVDPDAARAWMGSLSIAGTDGTLRGRFRGVDLRGRLIGKTGTLSTVIALSGILDLDPDRPLVFSLVTNTDAPLPKRFVRRAHERVIGVIVRYLASTAKTHAPSHLPEHVPDTGPAPEGADHAEEDGSEASELEPPTEAN